MDSGEAKNRIEQIQKVAQLALDRELAVLASLRARDRELQIQIATLEKQSNASDFGPADIADSRYALWQEWRLLKRKNLLGMRAAIRSDIEEATINAQRAFGRMQAAGRIQEKLS